MITAMIQWLMAWDIDLLTAINHHRFMPFDAVLIAATVGASYITVAGIGALLVLAVARRAADLRRKALALAAVFVTAAITSNLMKLVVYRDRPYVTYASIIKLTEGGNSSFPSAHTTEVFAMATAIALLFPRRRAVIIIAFLWACFIAYTRMALGVHYPSDVIGGMILGAVIGMAGWKMWARGKGPVVRGRKSGAGSQ